MCAFNGVLCVGKIDHLKVEVPLMVCKTDLCSSIERRFSFPEVSLSKRAVTPCKLGSQNGSTNKSSISRFAI